MLTESEPLFRRPLKHTPFHERARALCQVDSFIPWAGYSTVDVFTTLEQEYFALRNTATLYDLSPMVKYRIGGPDAPRYLDRLLTRDVRRLSPGRVAYVLWCNDAGHLIDDGTLFRLGPEEYRLCTAEHQLDWLLDAGIGFDVQITEVTEDTAALALQGPTACALLQAAGIVGIERLKPFDLAPVELRAPAGGACDMLISRTGFTGDLGYELWVSPADAEALWDALMQVGSSRGLRPMGSRALNLARIEAGLLLPHLDFIPAERTLRTGTARSPLELGLQRFVHFDKGHFNGRRALLAEERRGVSRRLVGLDIEREKPAHNALIYADRGARRQVGSVTSACWSPTCKRNIAFAMLDAPHFQLGNSLWAEIYLNRELVWERRMVRARVVERTFFAPERRRTTPPADH